MEDKFYIVDGDILQDVIKKVLEVKKNASCWKGKGHY